MPLRKSTGLVATNTAKRLPGRITPPPSRRAEPWPAACHRRRAGPAPVYKARVIVPPGRRSPETLVRPHPNRVPESPCSDYQDQSDRIPELVNARNSRAPGPRSGRGRPWFQSSRSLDSRPSRSRPLPNPESIRLSAPAVAGIIPQRMMLTTAPTAKCCSFIAALHRKEPPIKVHGSPSESTIICDTARRRIAAGISTFARARISPAVRGRTLRLLLERIDNRHQNRGTQPQSAPGPILSDRSPLSLNACGRYARDDACHSTVPRLRGLSVGRRCALISAWGIALLVGRSTRLPRSGRCCPRPRCSPVPRLGGSAGRQPHPRALRHPLWIDARRSGGACRRRDQRRPEATWTRLQELLAYGGVFWRGFQLCERRPRARQAISAWRSPNCFTRPTARTCISPRPRPVTSTFVNRNSYATYAGMTLLCGLGLVVQPFARYAPG